MNLLTKAPRGTQDILPSKSYKWRFIEDIMFDEVKLHGFKEIRTPVFEHTELFSRSVGEDTDVVQKEMYTFSDKGGRSITLKPEGTAGTVRSMLEHGLYNEPLPLKFAYATPCYRYEKPQSGRYREFHQFGVEMFGAGGPAADAQVISMASSLFARLGIENLSLQINSIGCKSCRKKYYNALKEYFSKYTGELFETCISRMDRNPMRILDCKSEVCSKIAKDAPKILDYICNDCKSHFNDVKEYLDVAKRVAHYFIAAVCEDYVPRCDFRQPEEPLVYDTSAGAIAASGLIEIAKAVPQYEKRMYMRAAIVMMKALEKNHCRWDDEEQSILMNCTGMYSDGRNMPFIYGDYFFTEAMYKLRGNEILFW